MGSWILWARDLAAHRVGVVGSSHNEAHSPRLVDVDQTSIWMPNTTASGVLASVDLGATYAAKAFALGGVENLAGETIEFIAATTLKGTTGTSTQFTIGTARDQLFELSVDGLTRYKTIRFPTAILSSAKIASWSILHEKITMNRAPKYDLGRDLELGYRSIEVPSGAEIIQHVAGNREVLTLIFDHVRTGSGELGDTIEQSLDRSNAWADGLWITGDEWVSPSGAAWYGRLVPGSLQRPINRQGRSVYALQFRTLTHGVRF